MTGFWIDSVLPAANRCLHDDREVAAHEIDPTAPPCSRNLETEQVLSQRIRSDFGRRAGLTGQTSRAGRQALVQFITRQNALSTQPQPACEIGNRCAPGRLAGSLPDPASSLPHLPPLSHRDSRARIGHRHCRPPPQRRHQVRFADQRFFNTWSVCYHTPGLVPFYTNGTMPARVSSTCHLHCVDYRVDQTVPS